MLLLFLGASLVAVGGALVASPWATGVGTVLALVALAARLRSVRGLMWVGLGFLAVATVADVSGWVSSPTAPSDLLALVNDVDRQRGYFLRSTVVAGCAALGCLCCGLALTRVRLHGQYAAFAVLGFAVLAVAAWQAADTAWRTMPRPPSNERGVATSFAVAYAPDPALDMDAAVAAGTPLFGAALVVLALVRLADQGK